MAEDEVRLEVEAVQAVYGDDCLVLDPYPPHIHVHIKPRTAEVSSQQFVEAVLGIRAGPQYPKEPPHIHIIESKGLDEQREKNLIASIQDRGCELSSCLMIVALCEEAVEKLSSMNHPDGNCPLCLYPLIGEDGNNMLPYMKLMSCFHCFHWWWNWLQSQKEIDLNISSGATVVASGDMVNQRVSHEALEESTGSCPVCRKVFHAKDIEHVLDLVGAHSQLSSSDADINENENLLLSDSEKVRREKFEAILKLQQENSGLIEPKRNEVLLPGMFLPRLNPQITTLSTTEANEQPDTDHTQISLTNKGSGSSNRPSTSENGNLGTRKRRGQRPRRQGKQWVKKENENAG